MSCNIIQGDCREVMAGMEAESVQCVVTSPPYWSLRDYGLPPLVWGGDADCEHEWGKSLRPISQGGQSNFSVSGLKRDGRAEASRIKTLTQNVKGLELKTPDSSGQFCHRCGAWRGSLGLEPTPELFVEHIVEVFREVWRVLRKDGTCWLNLGSSYASGGMNPSPSPLLWRAPACDTDGKEPQGSGHAGHACCGFDGEHPIANPNRHDCSAHNGQCAARTAPLPLPKDHGSGPLGCGPALPSDAPRAAQESTTRLSSSPPLVACGPAATASACPSEPRTDASGGPASSHTAECIDGSAATWPPLVAHTRGKESFFSACHRSDCKGIGKCGLCWCSLAIPSLNVKQKDLISIPALVAMALQADGWWLRSPIVWAKGISFCPTYSGSVMPESCTDRPTSAYEMVFLLTKAAKYFYDSFAVREFDREAAREYNAEYGNETVHNVLANPPVDRILSPQEWTEQGGDLQTMREETHDGVETNSSRAGIRPAGTSEVQCKQEGQREEVSLLQVRKDEGKQAAVGEFRTGEAEKSSLAGTICQERQTQGSTQEVLRKREGAQNDKTLSFDAQRQGMSTSGRSQTQDTHEFDNLRFDRRTMEGHQSQAKLPLCDLPRIKAVDTRPHHSAEQGRTAHGQQHSSSLPGLQQPQERQLTSRNLRNVWVINPAPCSEAHFATFPPKLVEPCILAGSSPKACGVCGAPYDRVVDKPEGISFNEWRRRTFGTTKGCGKAVVGDNKQSETSPQGYGAEMPRYYKQVFGTNGPPVARTTGWQPTCSCEPPDDTGRCLVLDPFAGTGTVGQVCKKHGRDFVGIELSDKYVAMARERLKRPVTLSLLKEA